MTPAILTLLPAKANDPSSTIHSASDVSLVHLIDDEAADAVLGLLGLGVANNPRLVYTRAVQMRVD